MKELITKLNEASELLSKSSGGYSGKLLSVEEFSEALRKNIK